MVPDALAWQGHGREGAGGGAPTVAGARGGCLLADGARHGRGRCYYPERGSIVSFKPTAPDFGGP